MLGLGLIGAVITAALHQKGSDRTGFLTGSILLMTTAMHIGGLYLWAGDADLPGAIVPMLHLYVATITLAVGIFIDVRLITALAIVPFAQMLDTGTFYWHAMYAFYSPETTLSILQLSVAMAVCVAVSGILVDRYRRHTHIFGIMAFIVANMCFPRRDVVGRCFGQPHLWAGIPRLQSGLAGLPRCRSRIQRQRMGHIRTYVFHRVGRCIDPRRVLVRHNEPSRYL